MGGTVQTENLLGLDDKPLDGWTLLSTTVVSGTPSEIDVINLSSDYFTYKFIWYGWSPVSNNNGLAIQTSSDNGISWDSAASDYAHSRSTPQMDTSPSDVAQGDNADSFIRVSGGMSNNDNNVGDMEITCFNPSSTEYTKFKWETVRPSAVADTWRYDHGAGVRLEAAAVNGV